MLGDIDIRCDVPKYRMFHDGVLKEEIGDLKECWQDDFVTFVIGCSFSFEEALIKEGVPIRHIEMGRNVPMFNTSVLNESNGIFGGNLVVSMRPLTPENAMRAQEITSRYSKVHGGPVHLGIPAAIGITDINKPDYGDAVEIKEGEIPVFWACGVTPQNAVMDAKPDVCITHSPGYMLVLD